MMAALNINVPPSTMPKILVRMGTLPSSFHMFCITLRIVGIIPVLVNRA
jgi:hypothetical protein